MAYVNQWSSQPKLPTLSIRDPNTSAASESVRCSLRNQDRRVSVRLCQSFSLQIPDCGTKNADPINRPFVWYASVWCWSHQLHLYQQDLCTFQVAETMVPSPSFVYSVCSWLQCEMLNLYLASNHLFGCRLSCLDVLPKLAWVLLGMPLPMQDGHNIHIQDRVHSGHCAFQDVKAKAGFGKDSRDSSDTSFYKLYVLPNHSSWWCWRCWDLFVGRVHVPNEPQLRSVTNAFRLRICVSSQDRVIHLQSL